MPRNQSNTSRCDLEGKAFAGSQRQIQHYVNDDPATLQDAISHSCGVPVSLKWVSPLRSHRYAEYRDLAFLKALGLSKHRGDLTNFWPARGPVWDALALDELSNQIVLIEAKSHLPEIRGGGCKAVSIRSRKKIDAAINETKRWLSVPPEAEWKGDLYQAANRIAHLHLFRNVLKIPAWLVNIYFVDDPHSRTSRNEWDLGIPLAKRQLGIDSVPFCVDLFLAAVDLPN
jgi:hypothetical protein